MGVLLVGGVLLTAYFLPLTFVERRKVRIGIEGRLDLCDDHLVHEAAVEGLLIDLATAEDDQLLLSRLCGVVDGGIEAVDHDHALWLVVLLPGDDDIDAVGEGLAQALKGLAAHADVLARGDALEVAQVGGHMPDEVIVFAYGIVIRDGDDDRVFHSGSGLGVKGIPTEKGIGGHALLAFQLQLKDAQVMAARACVQIAAAITGKVAGGEVAAVENLGLEDLHLLALKGRPCGRVGAKAADEVVQVLCRALPVDLAGLFKNLGCVLDLPALILRVLRVVSGLYGLHGFEHQPGTHLHEAAVEAARIIAGMDGFFLLEDDIARVDLVLEEESRGPRHRLTIHDRPVDGRGPAVLGQEGGVQVKSTDLRHVPDHYGQHAKGNDHLQVGLVAAQLLDKGGVLEIGRLQDGDVLAQGIVLDRRGRQLAAPALGLVGGGDDRDHIKAVFYQYL